MRLIEKAYSIAQECLKEDWREVIGRKSNPKITEVYKAVDGLGNPEMIDDSTTPWCSCFVNWCLQKAGGKGTRSAMARSWLRWGRKSEGKPGDVAVYRRGTNAYSGHVCFLVKKGIVYDEVIGGNQSNNVTKSKQLRINLLDYRTSLD